MIKATITRSSADESITSFQMTGHAEFAEKGQDLVCAGVSAVVFGSVNSIIALTGLDPLLDIGEEGGYFSFELPADTDPVSFEKAQLLLEGMVVSLETIERDYHDYVRISTKNRR
ncbi:MULTISPECIES: ribosomal-processing cysteine protease Prp [Bacillus]|uniref:ribosomal-processing cysteine protease Prp n=1 Tax=Bacillus TaxID=1386 RepID=UPI0021B1665B|nr:ribosomal-processing cysteine protease Prp [Bacillus safensis]UXC31347.1 ribosomal-processing cysteine protease Prp [Bacillus safensis]